MGGDECVSFICIYQLRHVSESDNLFLSAKTAILSSFFSLPDPAFKMSRNDISKQEFRGGKTHFFAFSVCRLPGRKNGQKDEVGTVYRRYAKFDCRCSKKKKHTHTTPTVAKEFHT